VPTKRIAFEVDAVGSIETAGPSVRRRSGHQIQMLRFILNGKERSLNGRPRTAHHWQAPLAVFTQTLANSHEPSSSTH